MKVEQLMAKNASACYPQSSLCDAARIMWERDCGFVPVVESPQSARVIGVLTDRDICMAAYTRGKELAAIRVEDAMAHTVFTCKPGDSLGTAEARLAEARVRRLPVVDDAEQLVGVISLADLARDAGQARVRGSAHDKQSAVGALIGSICQPRALEA